MANLRGVLYAKRGSPFNLKIRGSYGTAGNDRIPPYLFANVYTVNGTSKPYFIEDSPYSYLEPEWLSNPNLKWETMVTRNIGIDAGFFNNRLTDIIILLFNI